MSDHPLSPIPAADADRVYRTLTSAFERDPIARWLWNDDADYEKSFAVFAASAGSRAFETSTAWAGDDLDVVSLWLSPGEMVDPERVGHALLATVEPSKHQYLFELAERMESSHPSGPHWYLPWMAVAPQKQGQGRGGRLLAASLEYIDRGGLPVFLECSSPRGVTFFERYGFETVGTAAVGPIPAQTFMVRPGAVR